MSSPASPSSHPVRVRFAPSPTGHLHVGSIRSGLFNWLWARHNGGVSILRIEDTDRARLVEGALEQIESSMEALGIKPDEGPREGGNFGPYIQSERLDIYNKYAKELLESGALYRCWCSPERLTKLREDAQKAGVAFTYDRHCLNNKDGHSKNESYVLRFFIPEKPASISWNDDVKGMMTFNTKELDDFVAIKSDGFPTYHFANVVDDHLMEISHVLRADEWLPSTPKHLLLFKAFNWEEPIYAHLPPVQGPDGKKKLSKRDGAQSVQEYIDEGFLPEALRSFLASLGWNDGSTQEVYKTTELIEKFTLNRIQKSPAQFDKDRLTWVNGLLIRKTKLPELLERSRNFLPQSASAFDDKYVVETLALVQERLKFLSELPPLTSFFFEDPELEQKDLLEKSHLANSPDLARICLEQCLQVLHSDKYSQNNFTTMPNTQIQYSNGDYSYTGEVKEIRYATKDFFEYIFRSAIYKDFLLERYPRDFDKPTKFFMLARVALTNNTKTPGLFEMMEVLKMPTIIRRLEKAHKLLT